MRKRMLSLKNGKHLFSMIISLTMVTLLFSGCSNNKLENLNNLETETSSSSAQIGSNDTSEEKYEDMPYMNPDYKYDSSIEHEKVDPWVSAPFLLDSVKRLTVEDLTGNATFLGGSIYSFISKDGTHDQPPALPVGDNPPETAELYMASTDAVLALKEGDVIALAAINMHQAGAVQKIIKIHKTNGDFVHFTTQCPQTEEVYDKEGLKKSMEEHNKKSSYSET